MATFSLLQINDEMVIFVPLSVSQEQIVKCHWCTLEGFGVAKELCFSCPFCKMPRGLSPGDKEATQLPAVLSLQELHDAFTVPSQRWTWEGVE